jgi:hypothetical protein
MKNILFVFFAFILLACGNQYEVEISRATFEGTWPFTVESGTLGCDQGRIYFTSGDKTYGINGYAKSKYSEPDEIWEDNPELPGLKIGIGDVIKKGTELCD